VSDVETTEIEPEELDLDEGSMSNVWRSWSENASPELRAEFESRTGDCVREARAKHGSPAPGTGEYRNLRRDCIQALCRLSEAVQEEHDAEHQNR